MSSFFKLTRAQREEGEECLKQAKWYLRREENECAYWEIEKGAELRHPECQYRLAWLMLDKKYTYRKQTPLELLLDAADSGYSPAVNDVGYIYEYAQGVDKDLEMAIKWYKKAAKLENMNGIYNLGRFYINGYACNKDVKKGMELVRKAMEEGVNQAPALLGEMYSKGIGVQEDAREAAFYYRKAADMGNVDACGYIGWYYYEGIGVEKNRELAAKYYDKGAQGGSAYAQRQLAWCYERGTGVDKDPVKSAGWFLEAAKQGDAEAQYATGWNYYNGAGVETDINQAVYWYTKAAEQGERNAQYELGACYETGSGVEKSLERAAELYQKSAEQGSKDAQSAFGWCLMYGKGVEQDRESGFKWYYKAAELGDSTSMHQLGLAYYYGRGVEINYVTAAEWFTKAVEHGNSISEFWLGKLYEKGEGVDEDKEKAFKCYMKAAEAGKAEAQCAVGRFFSKGIVVEKDDAASAMWYEKAARQNNSTAQSKIGYYYSNGIGVEQNYSTAIMWYRKAAKKNSTAQLNLARFLATGKGALCNYPEAIEWCRAAVEKEKEGAAEYLAKLEKVWQDDIEKFEQAKCIEDINEACILAESAVKHGMVEAVIFCASRHKMLGNKESASQFYKLAADYNDCDSAQWYGIYCLEQVEAGTNSKECMADALKYLQQAGEAGSVEAQYRLGKLYCTSELVTRDTEKALYWFDKSAQGKHSDGTLLGARLAVEIGNIEKARELYEIAADWSVEAREWMMKWYDESTPERSGPKVLYWLKKAAEDDNGEAFYRLGIRCVNEGSREASYKAFQWAVDAGYPLAYSFCARESAIKESDDFKEESKQYYYKGADAGNILCYYPAYILYGNELDYENMTDNELVISLERLAAYLKGYIDKINPIDLEKRECSKRLAELMNMLGNKEEAIHYYEVAAEYGDVESAYCVGHMYHDGTALSRDLGKAKTYLEIAARSGHAKAQHELGSIFVSDALADGSERTVGIRWLKRAAARGDAEARQLLLSINC